MPTNFTAAYDNMRVGLASRDFCGDKPWQAIVERARKFVDVEGFAIGEARVVDDLRAALIQADLQGAGEAATMLRAAGHAPGRGPGMSAAAATITPEVAQRLGALKVLRHTYLLRRFGAHRVWCLATPTVFPDWPHEALKGDAAAASLKLTDPCEQFDREQRKHLGNASQMALRWVHKAMIVAGDPQASAHAARIARWFADAECQACDLLSIAGTLDAGLKKIAVKLMSGCLVYADLVPLRHRADLNDYEAAVWDDELDVVYIERNFFGRYNTLTGLANWTRIVIHELTHLELGTEDHAYESAGGIAPARLGVAKAIENADSWAWFCADCSGAIPDSTIRTALSR